MVEELFFSKVQRCRRACKLQVLGLGHARSEIDTQTGSGLFPVGLCVHLCEFVCVRVCGACVLV